MAITQTQTQKQTQKLTSQQIQLHNILALPTAALEQYIANEMAINPALEFEADAPEEAEDTETTDETDEVDFGKTDVISEGKLGEDYDYTDYMDREALDDYKYEANNHSSADDKREQVYMESHDFTTLLIRQLHLLLISEGEKELGTYIINSLDNDGYLRRELSDIADELSFLQNTFVTEAQLEPVLHVIHTLEPFGIGARNLQECLLIQLRNKKLKTKDTYTAIAILERYMEELSLKKFDRIKSGLGIDSEDLQEALAEIRKLNPVPAGSASENVKTAGTIEPDFTVMCDDDKIELFLNSGKHPPLKINDDYVELLSAYSKAKDKHLREASGFIKSKVESARWFIDALQQREKTMITVARAIVNHQKKFFYS